MSDKVLGLIKFIILFIAICFMPFMTNFLLSLIPDDVAISVFNLENIDTGTLFFIAIMVINALKVLQINLLYFLYIWVLKVDNNLVKAIFNKFFVSIFFILICICIDYYINFWGSAPDYLSTPFNIRIHSFNSAAYNYMLSLTFNFVILYFFSLLFKLKTFIKNKKHI